MYGWSGLLVGKGAGEFLQPSELFFSIVPGVEADGVGYLCALAIVEGEGCCNGVPKGEKLLVAYGVEGVEVALGIELSGFVFKALRHHCVYTAVDALPQFVAVAVYDDGFDVEWAFASRLLNDLAVGASGGEADFEGALDSHSVGEVYLSVVVGVDGAEHGAEAFNALVR